MKIVILGASGMVGGIISNYLKRKEHIITCFSRKKMSYTDTLFDIFDYSNLLSLERWVEIYKPHAIINCIGLLVKDCEDNPANAIYINSQFPHFLENMTKDTNTKIIHLSTDCIFNGDSIIPYCEDSLPDETNWYGRSKALGEINNNKDLTLRQSIIGPAPQKKNTGLFNWIFTQKESSVKGFSNVMWNGITTLELAKNIEKILIDIPQLSGIQQLIPDNEIISKYDLLLLIKKKWNLPVEIEKISEPHSFKILENVRETPLSIKGYKEQIDELYDYMQQYNIKVGHIN